MRNTNSQKNLEFSFGLTDHSSKEDFDKARVLVTDAIKSGSYMYVDSLKALVQASV